MKNLFIFLLIPYMLLTCGCVAHNSLRQGLYPTGSPTAPKQAARVVVIRKPGPPDMLYHKEIPWASAKIDWRGYPDAVATMLGSLYDRVSVADSRQQAGEADFYVHLSTDYPKTVGLSFDDAAGASLASFSRPGVEIKPGPDADSLALKILMPPALVVSFGALGLGVAYMAYDSGKRISAAASDATAQALVAIHDEIAASPALARGFPEPTATKLEEPLKKSEEEAPAGPAPMASSKADELEKEAARLRQQANELEKQAEQARGAP